MESTPTTFWQWAASLQGNEMKMLIFFGLLATVLTITLVTATIYKMYKSRLEDALKRELLDRGMTADEIATVVRAKPGKAQLPHEHNV